MKMKPNKCIFIGIQGKNAEYSIQYTVYSDFSYLFIWRLIFIRDYVLNQNRANFLHDFKPCFSFGFHSLIARDSRNAKFNQLPDLFIISVLSRTQLIWKFMVSISNESAWNIPTISFQGSQDLKCVRMEISGCAQPCCLVLLYTVFSVLPIRRDQFNFEFSGQVDEKYRVGRSKW